MKLRVLICLLLVLVVISDVTVVAATHYTVNVEFEMIFTCVNYIGIPEILYPNYINVNGVRVIRNSGADFILNFTVNHSINTMTIGHKDGYIIWCEVMLAVSKIQTTNATFRIYHRNHLVVAGSGLGTHILNLPCPSVDEIIPFRHALNFTLAGAMMLPTMTIGKVDDIMMTIGKFIDCGITKFTIRAALLKAAAKGVAVVTAITAVGYLFSHFADDIYYAIFTTVPAVQPGDTHFHKDDLPQIMGIIHSYFPTKPHITKAIEQAIRLHIDAYGMISVAEVMTIVKHKQEDIVFNVYKETPEILPENIPVYKHQVDDVMKIVNAYFPTEIPIRDVIEREIYRYIYEDIPHEISIEEVYEYIEKYQGIDITKLPPVFPYYVDKENLDDVVELIDDYFPVEIPTKNIIEEALKEQIIHDYPNEIPFEEITEIVEKEQNIYIPEIPVETPQQYEEYIREIIYKENYQDEIIDQEKYIELPAYKHPYYERVKEEEQLKDEILYYIIYDQTPCLFREIYETPLKPKEPKRPDEHLHTFPFYSIFVDPIANVIGIKLAHLFAAMMVVGCVISIASSWGVIGAILGGFIGTLMTSYFGLTSWLIPLYLVIVFIIYLNIKIRKGSDTG